MLIQVGYDTPCFDVYFGFSPLFDIILQVGYDTINSSEDQILKQDMPPALNRVEEASLLLLQASEMLRADPYSAPARKKLIEGSRGKDTICHHLCVSVFSTDTSFSKVLEVNALVSVSLFGYFPPLDFPAESVFKYSLILSFFNFL